MRQPLIAILVTLAAATALTAPTGSASARGSELVDASPTQVWVALTGPELITWSWNAVPGATRYRITISTEPRFYAVKTRIVTGRVATFTGLEPRTFYFASVRAMDDDSMSDPSNKASARTSAVAKPLTEVPQDRDAVAVRWAPYVGADKYQVQSSTGPTFTSNVESHLVTARNFTFGIERDSYGYFRVRAIQVTSTGGIRAISQWSPVAKEYVPYHPV